MRISFNPYCAENTSNKKRWEFIEENKKVRKQENTLSTKKATKKKEKG